MSSKPPSTLTVENLCVPLGQSTHATLVLERKPTQDTPESDELAIVLSMLDTLLKELPLEQWG